MSQPQAPSRFDPLGHALAYAGAGIPVFPCVPLGKTPITEHGFHDATTDPETIRAWWARTPNANIATPTGDPRIDVLDIDVRASGTGWAALYQARDAGLVDGWIRSVVTPSGGLHLHYPGTEQRNGSIRGEHLDFRAQGGYVLLPPSVGSVNGRLSQYRVTVTSEQPSRPLDWSAIVHELASDQVPRLYAHPSRQATASSLRGLVRHVESQSEGNRDNALFWAACRAVEGGITELQPLLHAAIRVGLPEPQARRTLRSAIQTVGGTTQPPSPTGPDAPAGRHDSRPHHIVSLPAAATLPERSGR